MHQNTNRNLQMYPAGVRTHLEQLLVLADELEQYVTRLEQQLAAAASGDPRKYIDEGVSDGYAAARAGQGVAVEWRHLIDRARLTVRLFEQADQLPSIKAQLLIQVVGAALLAGAQAGAQAQSTTAPPPPLPAPVPGVAPVPQDILTPPPPPPPPPLKPGEGSGQFARKSPSIWDRFLDFELHDLALGAEVMGLVDAARHMRHYADASGKPLEINPERMLRDMPRFQDATQNELDRFTNGILADLSQSYDGQPIRKTFSGIHPDNPWAGFYAHPDFDSQNWFLALGGFSYTYTAEAQVIPPKYPGGQPTVRATYQMHVFDRYNWDWDKPAATLPLPGKPAISDKWMGHFHEVGLAREYDSYGSTRPVTVEFPLTTGPSVPKSEKLPEARGYEDGRIDPVRPNK